MCRRSHLALLGAALFVLAAVPVASDAGAQTTPEIAVILHPDSSIERLSASELRSIFTMRRRHYSDGSRVVPFNLASGHLMRVAFDRSVLRMNVDQVSRYWIDRRIRGGSRPPRQVPSEEIMVRVVQRLPGAVGYARTSQVTSGVRVVAIVRNGRVRAP